ncbi:MAG: DsrE family protein [Zavarzinella sp.]
MVQAQPPETKLAYPLIKGYGEVVPRPNAAYQPQKGEKAVFDITSGGKPEALNKGLERAARLVNLYGSAGLKAGDFQLVLVLHGDATGATMTDAGYATMFQTKSNPNTELIGLLHQAGVKIYVCGQALNYKKIADDQVRKDIPIALSALNVVIKEQSAGAAYIPVP